MVSADIATRSRNRNPRSSPALLALDGVVTGIEGYALSRGHRWGYWLVVLVAAAFVPFELWSWLHQPTVGRALLLLANVGVALYLARQVTRTPHDAQRGTNA